MSQQIVYCHLNPLTSLITRLWSALSEQLFSDAYLGPGQRTTLLAVQLLRNPELETRCQPNEQTARCLNI